MWKPRRLITLWASMACYRDSFTFTFLHSVIAHKIEPFITTAVRTSAPKNIFQFINRLSYHCSLFTQSWNEPHNRRCDQRIMKRKGCGRKRRRFNLRYCSNICLKELKITTNFSQVSRCLGADLCYLPTEHEVRVYLADWGVLSRGWSMLSAHSTRGTSVLGGLRCPV
jgi:hypothetical protein